MSDPYEQARQGFYPEHPGERCDCPTCERIRSGEPLLGRGPDSIPVPLSYNSASPMVGD